MNINRIKMLFVLLISSSFQFILAQKDGYWDKERATKREIVVTAGDRIVIKTELLPVGTTEVVYRITLLDQNQQMASSLVSVLKSIPDPTGISQGSAGAIFLLSKISGEDKCKYAIFSNETYAAEYKKTGITTHACYDQNIAISKDAKGLSVDRSLCILPNSSSIWFGFESKNWIMNQKIVLEVVPWVNYKLSTGWNLKNRKLVLNHCKSIYLADKIIPIDKFCVCVLGKLQKEYKFQEFQKLLAIERATVFADLGNLCMNETGVSDKMYLDLRNQANRFVNEGMYAEAIAKTSDIIANGKASVIDFNRLGYSYIMTKQYSKAIKWLKEGEKLDDADLLLQMNLAHSYLLNNDLKSATSIYKKYLSQNVNETLSWIQKIKQDFETFTKVGLPRKDFGRVLKLLED